MDFHPPSWLRIDCDTYKRMLNREAVALTKQAKKDGGCFQVKDALIAIDHAFHCCNGTDPYDGQPLDGMSLLSVSNAVISRARMDDQRLYPRLPRVVVLHAGKNPEFEVTSWQTKAAKGDMSKTEFLQYCCQVAKQNNHEF